MYIFRYIVKILFKVLFLISNVDLYVYCDFIGCFIFYMLFDSFIFWKFKKQVIIFLLLVVMSGFIIKLVQLIRLLYELIIFLVILILVRYDSQEIIYIVKKFYYECIKYIKFDYYFVL